MNSRLLSRMEELREGKVRAESLGAWKKVKLREVLHERKTYSQKGEGYPHVTLSTKGISPKTERYDRDHLVKDEEKAYKITHKGDICYNPANLKFGVICENTFGDAIFSPIYVTFEVKEGVCREFLANYLMRWDFINAVRKYEEGTVYERMAVKPEDFLRYEIFLPPIEEQRKIAAILTAQDKVIELKEQLLAEKQRQKAYLMQQLLTGKKRLPGFGEEWSNTKLKDLLHERKTYSPKGMGYPHVTLSTGGISPKTERYDRDHLVKDEEKAYKITHKGDICYNPANLKFGVICENTFGDAIFSPIYVTFEVKEGVCREFLANYLMRWDFINAVRKYEEGTVYERMAVKPEDFLEVKVCVPQIEEQVAVAKVLSMSDYEIDLLRQSIEQERQKKKALMQLLLTGIVRVRP